MEERGLMVDGLFVPQIGLHGFRHLGEDVWGPRPYDKWKRLQCRIEGTTEHRAVLEMLYWRQKKRRGEVR